MMNEVKSKRVRATLGAVLIALLCVGCSDIEKGTITGKDYTPSWTQTNMIMVGKVVVPQIIVHPESWVVYIKDGDESGYCYVSEAYYKRVSVGEYIDCT
jgi:hypothetical protein